MGILKLIREIGKVTIRERSVNKSLDPCDDFYQFVCDGWKKKYPVPKDQLNYNQMYVLNDQLNEAIRDVLTHKNKSLGREFQLMYTYFDKCVEYQEDPGDDGLKDLFKKLRRYHSPSIKTLTDFLIASFPTQTFFKFSIDLDPENSTVKVFAISPHSSTLSFDQYFNEDIASSRDLYNAMISQTLTMLAEESENKDELFSKDTAARMLRAYTIVDMNLAKIINDSDGIKGENMQLEDISLKFKAIDWIKYLNAALSKSGWNYVKTKGILIEGPLLIKKYEDFISELDENVLRDYLDVRTVIAAMNDLPKKYQDLYEKLMEQYYGVVTLDKQKACFENIKEIFPDLLSVVYVDKYFNKSSIDDIAKLVNVIRNTMIEMLDEEGWMNFFTREKAKLKAENIAEIIAYDPQMYNETKRKEKYQNLTFTDSTSYYVINNIVEIWTLNMEIEDVSTPFGRGTVEFNAVEVNAFYQPQTNMIILLAGILHPPFFNASLPTILNYASMGLIVGHELTHAFDDTGSKFDEVGNMVNWWDTRTEEDFVNKTKCFEQQYGNITVVDGKRIRINGHDTLGENIADNGGVKLTIRAMQKVLDESKFHIVGLEEFTIEQLFFMVYGFSWCGNVKEEGLVQQVTTDVHSPDKQVLITFLLIL
ncbi:hypothetical protein WR25_23300 [Diploscapter pachys]|uniref:Peptidase M13 N-terminal domain-containing protein n=1 Tax=Diploscapter pachys TaxID=2018661 RepID=A0A2A2J790_9BILA|nr:hypothetical protein WR25_23300 [Diploscapter pachys]